MTLVCGMCFKTLAKRLPEKIRGLWVECKECHDKILYPQKYEEKETK